MLCEVDTVVVADETMADTVWLISSYMAHDYRDSSPNESLRRLLALTNSLKLPILIDADENSLAMIPILEVLNGLVNYNCGPLRGRLLFRVTQRDQMYIGPRNMSALDNALGTDIRY
ncbi:uncharacterized protein ACRADG_002027 [Cochliomyia hominivorax]